MCPDEQREGNRELTLKLEFLILCGSSSLSLPSKPPRTATAWGFYLCSSHNGI